MNEGGLFAQMKKDVTADGSAGIVVCVYGLMAVGLRQLGPDGNYHAAAEQVTVRFDPVRACLDHEGYATAT